MFLVSALATVGQADHPHLAQAWQAKSSGDGLPGQTGLESYIYEGCKKLTETCMNGHIFNYGADTCIKYQVDAGVDSAYTGTYYVNCDSVDCCTGEMDPDVKKWDIGQAGRLFGDKITHLGKMATTELCGKPVTADAYNEMFNLPFTRGVKANYTYFVTVNGTDTITHRIEYGVPGLPKVKAGTILYGDFKPQHNLTAFRNVFKAPPQCLKPNTAQCDNAKVDEWERKYFSRGLQLDLQ